MKLQPNHVNLCWVKHIGSQNYDLRGKMTKNSKLNYGVRGKIQYIAFT